MFWGDDYNISYGDSFQPTYPLSPYFTPSPLPSSVSGHDFGDYLSFDEWNFKRIKPSIYYTV